MRTEVEGSGPRLPAAPGPAPQRVQPKYPPAYPEASANAPCPPLRTAQLRGTGRAWVTFFLSAPINTLDTPNPAPSDQSQTPYFASQGLPERQATLSCLP